MLNIVLLCEYGASTSMVAEKIVEAAEKRGIEAVCNAYSTTEIGNVIDTADVILLGPQVRFRLKKFKDAYADKGVPMDSMAPADYGRMNGEALLDQALKLLEEK